MKLVIPTAAERSAAVDIKGITNKRAYDFLIPVEIRQSNIATYKKYMTPRSYWSRHPIRRRIIPAESARALDTRGSCHHQIRNQQQMHFARLVVVQSCWLPPGESNILAAIEIHSQHTYCWNTLCVFPVPVNMGVI